MASREDESIAIRPKGPGGIIFQKILPKAIRHRSKPHGGAGMPGICLLDGVHRKGADRVDAKLIEMLLAHRISNAGFRYTLR